MRARKQYLEEVWKEYQKASKLEKGNLLSEAQRRQYLHALSTVGIATHWWEGQAIVSRSRTRVEIDSWKTSYPLFAPGNAGNRPS